MPIVKIRRDEMEVVKEAAERLARRSNSRFVIDEARVEITDEGEGSSPTDEAEPKPPVAFG